MDCCSKKACAGKEAIYFLEKIGYNENVKKRERYADGVGKYLKFRYQTYCKKYRGINKWLDAYPFYQNVKREGVEL